MKINLYPAICLLGAVCLAPAQALQPAGDAAFFNALSAIRSAAALPQPQALRFKPYGIAAPADQDAIAARLDQWLGLFDRLELQPALDLAAVTAQVTRGLDSGTYNGVILGESHGTQPEINAGIFLTKAVLAARGIGAFSRERETFPTIDFLETQGVPVLTFKNQFKPVPDVQAGLAAAGGRPLVTYTGHAHTSVRLKNYFLFTLLEGKPWGYVPGGKDMVTVEDAFLGERKKPVIVAMVTEARVLRRVEQLFLREFIGEAGVSGTGYYESLRALRRLWENKVMRYPEHAEDIYFVRSPEQDNLFVGITPGERKPLAIDAVLQVLPLPEFKAWLGEDKLKTVESLWGSDESGVSYRVVAHKFSGEVFERTVRR
ncbi:MAG TPA: hypothetical protein PKI19_12810 [Elusimicrobiales bacterium]|nr:hypothetical protein [Elusimicrobiales bacterium]